MGMSMGCECIKNPRRRCICLWVTGVVVAVGLLFLILGLTVFKVRHPKIAVNSITLAGLDFSLETAGRLRVLFNVTLALGISIRNPNYLSFKYFNSTTFLSYRGTNVGQADLSAGKIGARDTKSLNFTLIVLADRLLSNATTLYSDIISGVVPLQNYVRIRGKVRILFVKVHVVVYSTCDFIIYLTNRTVSDPSCRYKTKI